jgi:transcriptional regulator with GAF, ATPase, and Fis domain
MMAETRALIFVLQIIAAAGWVAAALLVWGWGRASELGRSFSRLALLVAGWNLGIAIKSIPAVPEVALQAAFYPLFLIPAAALDTTLRLVRGEPDSRESKILWWAYAVSMVLCVLQTHQLVFARHSAYDWGFFGSAGPILPLLIAHMLGCIGFGLGKCWKVSREGIDERRRSHILNWMAGIVIFSVLGFSNFLPNYGMGTLPLGAVGSIVFLVFLAERSYRFRSPSFDRELLRYAPIFAQSAALAAPVIGLAVVAILLRSGSWFLPATVLIIGVGFFLFFAEQPTLRREVQRVLEELFFPARYAARAGLRESVEELLVGSDLADAASLRRILEATCSTLNVTGAGIYRVGIDGTSHVPLCTFGVFVMPGQLESGGLVVSDGFAAEGLRALPIAGRSSARGFLAVGPKHSGGVIDDSDLTLLTMVAAHVGLALELADANSRLAGQEAELIALRKKVDDEVAAIRAEVRVNPKFASIIGESNPIVATLHAVEQAASADIPVLITGETGTGKELIARAVHALSRRQSGPMIAVNCPAIPVELAEAELFGHERGAFTGANEARPGRFESANHGTLFLDEVADLPMAVQTKLLRVLQEQESQRLGSEKIHKLDFRVVAATNRDLHEEVTRGHFREDLLHRLAGVHIVVPPLRERRSDIPALATYFLERSATDLGKDIAGLSPDALETLVDYSWPGNIRELQNVIDRAVLLCTKRVILAEHLGNLQSDVHTFESFDGNGSLTHLLRDEKIRRVESTLTRTGGNQAAAARILGMSRSNLSRMMKRYGIKANRSNVDLDSTGTGDSNRGT